MIPVAGVKTRGYGWYYGYFHGADDFGAGCGTPIVAADSGSVEYAGWHAGGWGNTVWLDHGNGYKSRYAHMSAVAVSSGQGIAKGQVIGYVGATGLAYGCHLHFEILLGGAQINPDSVL
jgi:murein DD-endopeptidase MepM/ murein hydrolase activator NlpD